MYAGTSATNLMRLMRLVNYSNENVRSAHRWYFHGLSYLLLGCIVAKSAFHSFDVNLAGAKHLLNGIGGTHL